MRKYWIGLSAAALVFCASVAASAETAKAAPAASGAPQTTASGVYTKEQADRGSKIYFDNCSVCHGDELQGVEGTPGIAGQEFLTRWGGKPVSVLFNFINTQMPLGRPGVQGDRGTADIVAFILSTNEFPAGQSELPADNIALGGIAVVAQPAK